MKKQTKFVRDQKNVAEVKGATPRYYGDHPMSDSSGGQKARGTGKQITVKMGKVPNKKAKSFE